MRPRDSQRSKVYGAEGRAILEPVVRGQTFRSLADVCGYTKELVASPWFADMFPNVKTVDVRDGKKARMAWGRRADPNGVGLISMPKWSWTELIICHEVAHVCSTIGDVPHGAQFSGRYLFLVSNAISGLSAERLKLHMAL